MQPALSGDPLHRRLPGMFGACPFSRSVASANLCADVRPWKFCRQLQLEIAFFSNRQNSRVATSWLCHRTSNLPILTLRPAYLKTGLSARCIQLILFKYGRLATSTQLLAMKIDKNAKLPTRNRTHASAFHRVLLPTSNLSSL